ncbi:hypothetical protein PUMCH_001881 [Australozyma saopauloensis]|uniref:Increased recombination centers protein 6 n=1 Tax=Australozyma saopauloensis TaxID=291208 RepID=A0AAX4H7T9_9ASCO|nr:hypothetical protein PUMCH_001881 [[Candida] saopauloensis]
MGNNVLIVGPPMTGKVAIAQLITKDLDSSTISSDSHSGLVYKHTVTTKYFKAEVNILIEEYPDKRTPETTPEQLLADLDSFRKEFSKDEYKTLRDELEGILFTLNLEQWKGKDLQHALDLFESIRNLFDEHDLFYAVVGNGKNLTQEELDEVEDEAVQFGFEFVDTGLSGENEYREKIGQDRLVDLFECHEWSDIVSDPARNLQPDDASQMGESLLGEKQVALDELLEKVKSQREKVKDLEPAEKQQVVQAFVNDIMEHI